jgi:resuscitation-promoting factor RpfB
VSRAGVIAAAAAAIIAPVIVLVLFLGSIGGAVGTGAAAATGAAPGAVAGGMSAKANEQTGASLAAAYGWTGTSADCPPSPAQDCQLSCLDWLWTRESGWSQVADTRLTGAGGDHPGSPVFAYGVAQARPATKYPLAGRPPDLGGSSDPATQISWGLAYIAAAYGTPCAAWAHEESAGWY